MIFFSPALTEGRKVRQLYVRRGSRMTDAQERGYSLLDNYRFDPDSIGELGDFSREDRKLLVEIGFGNGDVILSFAKDHPDWNCLGVEVFRPGIGSLIRRCREEDLENVRIAETDGLTLLESLPDSSIDLMFVFFPDPWPKRKHRRRRLVDSEFAQLASCKLNRGSSVYLATDWEDYALQIEEVMSGHPCLAGGRANRYALRPKTRFEERGEKLGHNVWDFRYERTDAELREERPAS